MVYGVKKEDPTLRFMQFILYAIRLIKNLQCPAILNCLTICLKHCGPQQYDSTVYLGTMSKVQCLKKKGNR